MFFVLVLSLFVWSSEAQGYCKCGGPQFVLDTTGECLASATYDVENSCYTCPVTDSTGTRIYCSSVFGLGFANCAAAGALAAYQNACFSINGSVGSSEFTCRDSTGTNQSQVLACSAPSAFTSAAPSAFTSAAPTTTGSGTNAPTSDASSLFTPTEILLALGVLLFCYVVL